MSRAHGPGAPDVIEWAAWTRDPREWLPETIGAVVVLVAGLAQVLRRVPFGLVPPAGLMLTVAGIAVAVLLCRRLPGAALALVWVVGIGHLLTVTPVLTVEAAVAVVAFGCARWGSIATVVLSGLSIPGAAAVAAVLTIGGYYGVFEGFPFFSRVVDGMQRFGDIVLVGAVVFGLLVLMVPWLAGLLVRSLGRTRRSEISQLAAEEDAARAQHEAFQAQEIAHLREGQARLARDVHDVVGHSLAVILAQAESAQYLPDDPARLKETMATVADSARTSLQDVRHVLSSTPQTRPAGLGGLEELAAGVRATGQEVVVEEVGQPQPLPPELEMVAHRVLQEMLTNAVRHGRRDRPIRVERLWPSGGHEHDLRIEVGNALPETGADPATPVPASPPASPPGVPSATDPTVPISSGGSGQGLDGMRRRLDSVGGKLDVRSRDGAFVATAWIPVRSR
jgi:signal transduction histidine kinase